MEGLILLAACAVGACYASFKAMAAVQARRLRRDYHPLPPV